MREGRDGGTRREREWREKEREGKEGDGVWIHMITTNEDRGLRINAEDKEVTPDPIRQPFRCKPPLFHSYLIAPSSTLSHKDTH